MVVIVGLMAKNLIMLIQTNILPPAPTLPELLLLNL